MLQKKNSIYHCLFQYELRLAAIDNHMENFTTVAIHVRDVNDNPPVFERPTYRTQITEEDDRNLPKKILQVQTHKHTCLHVSGRTEPPITGTIVIGSGNTLLNTFVRLPPA